MEYLELPDGTSYLHLLKNRTMLWDINTIPQLHEVEIIDENHKDFDKNFDDILNMNGVYCSICNLDIPKIYLKQHYKSSIHQNLVKLTEEVLERTKKHLKNNDEPITSSLNVTDTFFCDICSKIIQNRNKDQHFESKFHKKQIIFEKLLNFFVKYYLRVQDDGNQFDWEDGNDCMDNNNESNPLNEADLLESIKDPSQIALEPDVCKDPSDITTVDPAINILDLDHLDKLLELAINNSSVKRFKPLQQNGKDIEKRNLPTLQTSMELSTMDPTNRQDPIPKDVKSDNQSYLNTINPNLNPMHSNFHHINPMNPNLNQMDPNLNPMNPNFHNMNPNLNPMNPNLNTMALNLHHRNPMNANWNHVNPNFNAINPNLNPMISNCNPMNPNFNSMHSNFNPMNPNFNPINPNFNHVNLNFNPMNLNLNPTNPNFNPMNPHFTPMNHLNPMDCQYQMNPNFKPKNPNLHPMDPRYKFEPNLHPMDPRYKFEPNLHPMDPRYKLGPNLIKMNPQSKLEQNLIKDDPQSKLGPNLITKDPQFELGPNLNTTDPQSKLDVNSTDPAHKLDPNSYTVNAETKKINKAERRRERQMINYQAFQDFSTYIKNIQEKYPKPGFKIEAVTVKQIKLTALNGDTVVVLRANFESYNQKYCRVCQNGNLKKDHELSEEHISRIMVPVADKNCIREIDDIWSHCIVCNELIKFVQDHNKTAAHLENLKKCFIDIPKQIGETDPKHIEELFNENIVSDDEEEINVQYTEKELNEQEMMKVADEEENRLNAQEKKEEKRVDLQEKQAPFKFDIDKFSNTLADKLLPLFAKYAITKVDETLQSENKDSVEDDENKVKQSKENIQNVVDENDKSRTAEPKQFDDEVASNSSSTSKNITKYCSVCKAHVKDFETHKTSEMHMEINNTTKELRKKINRNNLKEIKDSALLKCDLCEVDVNYNPKHIDEHVNSQRHRRNYFKFIESNKIILIDQVESQCEPCNKTLHRSNIFDHCKLDKHVKKLKDLLNIASSQTKPNTTKNEDTDVTKMLYHFRAQGVEYLCKTCHVLVARDAASVKGHVESKLHIEKYNTLLRSNNIFKTTGSFYCEVCNAKIPMTGEITHVYGRNHLDKLVLKATNKVVKDESNEATAPKAIDIPVIRPSSAPIASTSKAVPVSSNKIEMTVPFYVKYQYKIVSETVSACIICDEFVKIEEITYHAHLPTHNFNFNLAMINNTIKIKGNVYFCVNCNTSVPVFGEVQHIVGKLHLNKKKQKPIASNGTGMLTYDHVLGLTQGKRMVKL